MIIDFDSKNKGGGGKEPVVETLNVTANGSYNAPSGVDGYNPVEVNVPERVPVLESLSVTENGTYNAPSNIDGYNTVSVNVPQSGGTGFNFNQLNGLRFNTNGTTIDLTGLDTSTFTSMSGMFSDCYNLTSLDLSHFDTSKVTNMYYMFNNCGNLTSLDLSHFDTSNVTNMSSMFLYCSKITSLDLSHFDTSKVTNMGQMFWNCSEITSLNISNWDASNVTSMRLMFDGLYSIETIISDGLQLPNIDLSNIGLHSSPLTVDSIVGLLNALPTTTNGYSFDIGSTNIAKLSDDQKSIATSKGWLLV